MRAQFQFLIDNFKQYFLMISANFHGNIVCAWMADIQITYTNFFEGLKKYKERGEEGREERRAITCKRKRKNPRRRSCVGASPCVLALDFLSTPSSLYHERRAFFVHFFFLYNSNALCIIVTFPLLRCSSLDTYLRAREI